MNKKLIMATCMTCGEKCGTYRSKYCSNLCQHKHKQQVFIEKWLAGGHRDVTKRARKVSRYIRSWLFEQAKHKCSRCGWSERHPVTGSIPLEVDHIDGDCNNCAPENLRVLCPNCHSLTPNYRALNRGQGRKDRYS